MACNSRVEFGSGDNVYRAHVSGSNADEVQRVVMELVNAEAKRRAEAEKSRLPARKSPWGSGSFYLVAAVIVVGGLVAAGLFLSWWTLPLILIGGVLIMTVVGALQLKHDDQLSEQGFLELMRETLLKLPLLVAKKAPKTELPEAATAPIDEDGESDEAAKAP